MSKLANVSVVHVPVTLAGLAADSRLEFLVLSGRGQQVFMMSWRNPDARHAKWDFDTYGQAVLDAMDAVERITRSEQVALMGCCSGGIIAAMVAAHLAHIGRLDHIAAFTLMVTVLDESGAGLGAAVIDERTARLAAAASRARGYLDGRSLAEVFAWLRPNDLIWNYWVNNYLLGREPPKFDILFWNADTTMVNPPGNEKARYQVAKECPGDPQEWLRRADNCHGTWWPDYVAWLAERCGEEQAAPDELGGGGLAPICDGPGTYVYDH